VRDPMISGVRHFPKGPNRTPRRDPGAPQVDRAKPEVLGAIRILRTCSRKGHAQVDPLRDLSLNRVELLRAERRAGY
jgi:hypothetical protein